MSGLIERSDYRGLLFWLTSPLIGLLIPSTYVGLSFLLRIIEFSRPLAEPGSVVYFVGGIACMILISWLTIFTSTRQGALQVKHSFSLDDWKALWAPFLVLGLIGGVFIIMDYGNLISYSSFNLYIIRQSFSGREVTPFAYFSNLLAPFSVMLLGVTLILLEELSLSKRALGLAIGIGVPMVYSVGLAGRSAIVDLLVLMPWWLLQRPVFGKPIFPGRIRGFVVGVLAVVSVLYLLTLVSVSRSRQGEQRFLEVLWFNKPTVVASPTLEDSLYKVSPTLATGLSEALFYWSAPVVVFDKLYKHWGLPPDYMSALSQVLHRRLVSLGLSSLIEAENERAIILLSYGIWPNVFSTAAFDLIRSFGRIGAFIAQIVFAMIASYLYVRARKERVFAYMYLSSLFYLMFFLWFQRILTSYPLHEYGFYWCGAFLVLGLQKSRSAIRSGMEMGHGW